MFIQTIQKHHAQSLTHLHTYTFIRLALKTNRNLVYKKLVYAYRHPWNRQDSLAFRRKYVRTDGKNYQEGYDTYVQRLEERKNTEVNMNGTR